MIESWVIKRELKPVGSRNKECHDWKNFINYGVGESVPDLRVYTMVLPPRELVDHVWYTDVGSLQHLRWRSLWNRQ